jgi:hypothetical protein
MAMEVTKKKFDSSANPPGLFIDEWPTGSATTTENDRPFVVVHKLETLISQTLVLGQIVHS